MSWVGWSDPGMRVSRLLWCAAVCSAAVGGLAACSGPAPPPLPPPSFNAFDGRYVGTVRVTGAAVGFTTTQCATPQQMTFDVHNDQFTYVQQHQSDPMAGISQAETTQTYQAYIAPDGRILGNSERHRTLTKERRDSNCQEAVSGPSLARSQSIAGCTA